MKTTFMQSKETVVRDWYVIDAKDMPLGRVAAKAAIMLRGKHKATYTPHIDCGDNIIIINASEVVLTGNKLDGKKYYASDIMKLEEEYVKDMSFEEKIIYQINGIKIDAINVHCTNNELIKLENILDIY